MDKPTSSIEAPPAVQAEPNIYKRAAQRLKDGKPGIPGTLDDEGNFVPDAPLADDEAVMLLREARYIVNGVDSDLLARIDAYLAKARQSSA